MRTALDGYAVRRRHPEAGAVSHLSPYLQYGQISAQRIAATVAARPGTASADRDAFLDELIVRRELAHNYTLHHPAWDRYEGIPAWARETLARHAGDPRPHVYELAQLEAAATHDPYWNAAMTEARLTGYMHNHLRMYWGKKILEWSPDAQTAHARCLYLNNRYFLDGLSPNSYANVGWLFGLHDRPWPERPIFGTVRYMNAAGLERKCDIAAYVAGIGRLAADDIKRS
jgi:deoxyribodipyrimidine photo-lyase